LKEGTFNGTARALTAVFDRIESRYGELQFTLSSFCICITELLSYDMNLLISSFSPFSHSHHFRSSI
jgi:hypothetical protein